LNSLVAPPRGLD